MKYFFPLILAINLFAQNPTVYKALGDVIYDNSCNISKLQNIKRYKPLYSKINAHLTNVLEAKSEGFKLEYGFKTVTKEDYLKKLRDLSVVNDNFMRIAEGSFNSSIEHKDSMFFSQIINTGLIDIKKNKKKIIKYYLAHSNEIDTHGVIDKLLKKNKRLRAKVKKRKKSSSVSAKVKRLRAKDKREQKELESKLEKETNAKKKIIQDQKQRDLIK